MDRTSVDEEVVEVEGGACMRLRIPAKVAESRV